MKKNKQYIRIGDTVQMIFTDEIGVVVDYFDGETLIVGIDGEEIPVFAEHLKKMEKEGKPSSSPTSMLQNLQKQPGQKRKKKFVKKEDLQKKKIDAAHKINEMRLQYETDNEPDRGIQVALQPFYDDQGDITYFLIHLLNDSGYSLQFDYQMSSIEGELFELKKKKIGGREPMILNSMNYDSLNDQPQLHFKFQVLKSDLEGIQKNFEKIIKPKAKMLRRLPQLLPTITAKAYTYSLVHKLPSATQINRPKPKKSYLDKLKQHDFEEEQKNQDFSEKVYINAEERIIDLHIEKLVKSYRHLPKNYILQLQMNECQKSLEEAIKRKEKNMVIIHGLGKGKLKREVFKLLMNYSEVKNFKNEYNHRYGFGATEVFFEYEED